MKWMNSPFIFIIISGLFLQSCLSLKKYERPAELISETQYRTDNLSQDSISMADLGYREIFKDVLLQNHIAQALENNIDIRVALENINISDAYVKQAKAAYFPNLQVGPGVTYQTQSMNTQFGQIIGDRSHLMNYDISASASWQADIWGKLKSAEKAQYASYLQSVAAHQAVKSEIVAQIASSYYRLLALDEQKRTTEETILLREKSLETTQALKDAGVLTEVAVKQTEALLLNHRAYLIEIENSIHILENQISYLMGIPSQSIARSDMDQQEIPTEIKLGVPASLLRNRPDVMAAEYGLIQAFEDWNFAHANLYPSLNLSANTGLQSVDLDKLFSVNSWFATVAAGLTQPVLQQRRLKTQKEVAEFQQEKALLNFRKTLLLAGKEVSDALHLYNSQDEFIALKQLEYEQYFAATAFSQELMNYGMANYLEVLTAQQNALNAQLAAIQAKFAQLNALVNLYNALGGGWKE
ncbi:MAG: efflux transporter outer membrane subunit [Flavobacteriaceae bacterium]|nr:efflux transporter outer membrane subunit [Flavobacteriaceae bacterium]